MKNLILASIVAFASWPALAQETPAKTLITNVQVFDGENETLIENATVLIEGNLIKLVSTEPVNSDGATVIDGRDRTMIPGLTDVHWHMTMAEVPQETILTGDVYEVAA